MRNLGFYVMQESVAQQIRLLLSQRTSVFKKGPLSPGRGCLGVDVFRRLTTGQYLCGTKRTKATQLLFLSL